MSQIGPPPLTAGDLVTVRGTRWNIDGVQAFADCALITLSPAAGQAQACTLLYPFDRPTKVAMDHLRVVTRQSWTRRLGEALATSFEFGRLRASASADVDLYSFQLEPALAAISGRASRFLIADEVGLGKTIQAGLMLSELAARGLADRVLILTPAGLRDQWASELERRFAIRATVTDAGSLRERLATLPQELNPWAVEPISIASIDFVRQPEILAALATVIWDVLIVDEAHLVATAPHRSAAVRALAARARLVLMLTATPHAGDESAFSALCGIGRAHSDDALMIFRRTRRTEGLAGKRRVRLLPVRLSVAEERMHRLLRRYVRLVWREGRRLDGRDMQLVSLVLMKRALSSPASLARSIERRLDFLPSNSSRTFQPGLLPTPDVEREEDIDDSDAAPLLASGGLPDRASERDSLLEILAVAMEAAPSNRKLALLRRLLRRTREPAIVFTEYRDTLEVLAGQLQGLRHIAIVHGGLPPDQRRRAVESFNAGSADLLLTTDAGGQGLNLHVRCRLVISLELPWNPMRLEQRIGRVDRLGQGRTVHVVHLVARDTAEVRVLSRLFQRLQRIRASVDDVSDPLSSFTERAIARAVIDGDPLPVIPRSGAQRKKKETTTADLIREAGNERERLLKLRDVVSTRGPARDGVGVPVARLGGKHLRRRLGAGGRCIVWILTVRIADSAGRVLERRLIPVKLPLDSVTRLRTAGDIARLARGLTPQLLALLRERAKASCEPRRAEIARLYEPALLRWARRENAIGQALDERPALVQAGLFDARAVNVRTRESRHLEAAAIEQEARNQRLRASGAIAFSGDPECSLVLVIDRR